MSSHHHIKKSHAVRTEPTTSTHIESNLVTAMLAGSGAAVVQTVTTYPFEFVKTAKQLYRSFPSAPHFKFETRTFKEYFIGCHGLAVGNALKSSSRFVVFNSSSKFMSNENGKTTAPRVVIAGIMTGLVESLWVIPFENIKTTSIQNYFMTVHGLSYSSPEQPHRSSLAKTAIQTAGPDRDGGSSARRIPLRNSAKRQVSPNSASSLLRESASSEPATRFIKVVQEIYNTRGVRGFWQGSAITIVRQTANSAVWFSSYNFLRQALYPTDDLSPTSAMALSVLSSVNVILITQPIDVVKTRMQAKNSAAEYRDTLTCLVRTFMNEGMPKLWSGWLPRFFKVSLGGSITLYSYNLIETGVNAALNENPFGAE